MNSVRRALLAVPILALACAFSPSAGFGQDGVTSTRIQDGGRYPRYNAATGKVAFDMRTRDFGDVGIYVMNLDGTGQTGPITDDTPGSRHKGQPYWHPSGDYIIFTAEQDGFARNGLAGYVEQPGLGRNNNVWLMKADGSRYWKLTDVVENGSHIRASFSDDGTKVMWNEDMSMEVDPQGCSWKDQSPTYPGWEYCNFRIVWGDFGFDGDNPQVTNLHRVEFFDEGGWRENHTGDNGLYVLESQGFSPDGERIIFTACDPYQTQLITGSYTCLHGGDYYTTNLDGTDLVRLTNSIPGHKENAEYSPDGARIIYTRTDQEVGKDAEWYLMRADASDFPGQKMTSYMDPASPTYVRNAFGGEGDWVDEDTFLLNVPWWEYEEGKVLLYSNIYRLDGIPAPAAPATAIGGRSGFPASEDGSKDAVLAWLWAAAGGAAAGAVAIAVVWARRGRV